MVVSLGEMFSGDGIMSGWHPFAIFLVMSAVNIGLFMLIGLLSRFMGEEQARGFVNQVTNLFTEIPKPQPPISPIDVEAVALGASDAYTLFAGMQKPQVVPQTKKTKPRYNPTYSD